MSQKNKKYIEYIAVILLVRAVWPEEPGWDTIGMLIWFLAASIVLAIGYIYLLKKGT